MLLSGAIVADIIEIKASDLAQVFEGFANRIREAFSQPSELAMSVEENERERYASALMLVAHFFRTLGVPFAHRFAELGTAVADLNEGAQPPILSRQRRASRDASDLWCARAHVALGLHARLRLLSNVIPHHSEAKHRPDLKAAAREIKVRYPQLKNIAGKKAKSLEETIINWRKEFLSSHLDDNLEVIGRVRNWLAVNVFTTGKERIEAIRITQQLREFADTQLAIAAQISKILEAKKRRSFKTKKKSH
jgi:hypothetical protein